MAGRYPSLWCALTGALALLTACSGTERALFGEIQQPTINPPEPPEAGSGGGGAAGADEPQLDASLPPLTDAGVAPPPLDPNVTFTWTETLPGKGTCRQGLYIGGYTCKAQGDLVIPLLSTWTGQLVFTLRGSMEEQLLTVTEGVVSDDTLVGAIIQTSPLEGSLNCLNDQRFEARFMAGRSLTLGDYEEVSVLGRFDPQTLVISGTFEVASMSGDRWTCAFEANAAP